MNGKRMVKTHLTLPWKTRIRNGIKLKMISIALCVRLDDGVATSLRRSIQTAVEVHFDSIALAIAHFFQNSDINFDDEFLLNGLTVLLRMKKKSNVSFASV